MLDRRDSYSAIPQLEKQLLTMKETVKASSKSMQATNADVSKLVASLSELETRMNEQLDRIDGILNGIDTIVEQGTASSWYYRKWKSGVCELWRNVTATFAMTTSGSGGYTSAEARTLTLPFSVNNAVAFVATNGANFSTATANGTTFTYRPYRMASSSSAERTFRFFVLGRWK